ncbi:MAG TPA: pyridoxal-phosphate dependent enzyme [Oleiagrimonas sp.]|nr:pyridoxal-phosphate dependent enzyme [Oleiagrimonas sp.]
MARPALPTADDIRHAAARIAAHAVVTPIMRNAALDEMLGASVHFKCEHLQRSGAFKFRGACNAVWSLTDAEAARGVVTHSSGNHGNALAQAAATRGISAHVVVPEGAVQAKVDAIKAAGATLHRCAPTQAAREATTAEVQAQTGATLVHPYTDVRVMAGQGTAALELLQQAGPLDALLTPVGGGGLASGCAVIAHAIAPDLPLFAAEPEGADDAARSLARGEHVTDVVPDTICDGLRATIGEPNIAALRTHHVDVLTVSDAEVIAAMKLLWQHLKQTVEPSSATILAAMLRYRERFAGMRVGVVLSGGNVDLDALPWMTQTA